MVEDTYLFIDGNYLREVHQYAMKDFFGARAEINYEMLKSQAGASRAFLYDCLDDIQRDGEVDADFRARVRQQEDYLTGIRTLRGYHVRLGTLSGKIRGRRRHQKEVDVLLAVDMLTHGLNRNMRKGVLVAGDLDFRPIVEALVQNGVFAEVWYERSSAANELHWAADFGRELRFNDLYALCDADFQRMYKPPRAEIGGVLPTGRSPLKIGKVLGSDAWLFKSESTYQIGVENFNGRSLRVDYEDLEKLEKYMRLLFAPIEWHQTQEVPLRGMGK